MSRTPKKPKLQKRSKLTSLGHESPSALEKTRARGIFGEALDGERFGKHPGMVDLRIDLSIYNAMSQTREKLPGKQIDILVSSIDEVDEMTRVIRQSLNDWVQGIYHLRR